MLEDLSGALELFQETQALIGTGSDEDFDMYVKEVKALVEVCLLPNFSVALFCS